MSGDQMAKTRLKWQDHYYLITAYHDGLDVSNYKIQRESWLGSEDDAPAYDFTPLVKDHVPYLPIEDLWDMDEIPSLIAEYENRVFGLVAHLRLELKTQDSALYLEIEGIKKGLRHLTPSRSYLYMNALTSLIENADVRSWAKNSDELQPADFWRLILIALVTNYNNSLNTPHTNKTVDDVLQELLPIVRRYGGLDNPILEE